MYCVRDNQHPPAYHILYLSIFLFLQYASILCKCIQNLKTGSLRRWEICDEKFILDALKTITLNISDIFFTIDPKYTYTKIVVHVIIIVQWNKTGR